MNTAQALAELMSKYNEARANAEKQLGGNFNEAEFNAWFTKQVMGK